MEAHPAWKRPDMKVALSDYLSHKANFLHLFFFSFSNRAVSPTSTSCKTRQPRSYSRSKRSAARSAKNPCRRRSKKLKPTVYSPHKKISFTQSTTASRRNQDPNSGRMAANPDRRRSTSSCRTISAGICKMRSMPTSSITLDSRRSG